MTKLLHGLLVWVPLVGLAVLALLLIGLCVRDTEDGRKG